MMFEYTCIILFWSLCFSFFCFLVFFSVNKLKIKKIKNKNKKLKSFFSLLLGDVWNNFLNNEMWINLIDSYFSKFLLDYIYYLLVNYDA